MILLMFSITLPKLLLGVGLVAVLLTGAVALINKGQKNWVMSYLQNFTGFLFVFSGDSSKCNAREKKSVFQNVFVS